MTGKNRRWITAAMMSAAVASASFTWPVDRPTVTSTYGESRWDHFHDGIDLVSPDDAVKAAERGRLIYYWDKAIFPLDNYPGGGNFKVLVHPDGRYSIYMHLEDGMPTKQSYETGEPIGRMGNTGHSYNKHLHFSILSPKVFSSENPLAVMPPIHDASPPVVSEFGFRIGDRCVVIRDGADVRLTKHYPLLVKITDSMGGRQSLGIHRITVSHNGREVLRREFSRIELSGGRLTVEKKPFEECYDPEGYYRVGGITYVPGENTFTVVAEDFAGNRTEKTFAFTVRLDPAP